MKTKDFQVIPNEIIDAWIRGEYYSGETLPISYQYIGISLALRGWYIYEQFQIKEESELTETKFKGIAMIGFKDGSLFIGGIRLYAKDIDVHKNNVFWSSEFSHFLNENEILWYYKIYKDVTNWLKNYITDSAYVRKNFSKDRFGLLKDTEWNSLLDALRTRFYDDLRNIETQSQKEEASIDKGICHFFIKDFVTGKDEKMRGRYMELLSREPSSQVKRKQLATAWDSYFTRVSKL